MPYWRALLQGQASSGAGNLQTKLRCHAFISSQSAGEWWHHSEGKCRRSCESGCITQKELADSVVRGMGA